MSMGPWQQSEFARSIKKVERARFRRAIENFEAELWRELSLQKSGTFQIKVRSALRPAMERLRSSVTIKKKKINKKVDKSLSDYNVLHAFD